MKGGRSRVGEPMPLDRGSPGQVLLAFAGEKGPLYDSIRKRGFHHTIGEARAGGASISAPVFGSRWNVVGALCIGVPASDATDSLLLSYAPALIAGATKLSRALARQQARILPLVNSRSSWHPQ
jgi:DNA-binding IclR family transcriptional regulator